MINKKFSVTLNTNNEFLEVNFSLVDENKIQHNFTLLKNVFDPPALRNISSDIDYITEYDFSNQFFTINFRQKKPFSVIIFFSEWHKCLDLPKPINNTHHILIFAKGKLMQKWFNGWIIEYDNLKLLNCINPGVNINTFHCSQTPILTPLTQNSNAPEFNKIELAINSLEKFIEQQIESHLFEQDIYFNNIKKSTFIALVLLKRSICEYLTIHVETSKTETEIYMKKFISSLGFKIQYESKKGFPLSKCLPEAPDNIWEEVFSYLNDKSRIFDLKGFKAP